MTDKKVPGAVPRQLAYADFLESGYPNPPSLRLTTNIEEANLVTSLPSLPDDDLWETHLKPSEDMDPDYWDEGERLHYPVLDLDIPVTLVPSTTPGHSHLYIDHPVREGQFYELMDLLASMGILEQGYVSASKYRGYTSVRPPWVKKVPIVKHVTQCVFCKKEQTIKLTEDEYNQYKDQRIIPKRLDMDKREALISGTCPSCWDTHMKDPDDE